MKNLSNDFNSKFRVAKNFKRRSPDDEVGFFYKGKHYTIVQCPYCGNMWAYGGSAKHYASCTKCNKKVRLHPYIRRGHKPLTPLKFPNINYTVVKNQ